MASVSNVSVSRAWADKASEFERLLKLVCLRASRPEDTGAVPVVKVPAALVEQARTALGYKTCERCGRWDGDVKAYGPFGDDVLCAEHAATATASEGR